MGCMSWHWPEQASAYPGALTPPDAVPGNLISKPWCTQGFSRQALQGTGGFSFSEAPMTEAIASALIVTAPSILTNGQVDHVRAGLVRQLPAGTVMLVIPPGFTVHMLGSGSTPVESMRAQVGILGQQLGALCELQKTAATIADAMDTLGNATMRVTP
jgi:hypothetical protein